VPCVFLSVSMISKRMIVRGDGVPAIWRIAWPRLGRRVKDRQYRRPVIR
jgi:hypothetical protein